MQAALAMATARQLLAAAEQPLRAAGIDTTRLDAEVLLAWAMGVGRAGLYARLDDPVSKGAVQRFEAVVQRRRRREPLAYLTGVQEFWSLPFAVSPAVLVPRPETELLVELAVRRATSSPTILDLGTGSGCIAVALARELPQARISAVDLSPEALGVARANAGTHGVADRIDFALGDLFDALPPAVGFDLVVSNPPYLAPGDAASPELAYEPSAALAAGADGLDVIRRIVAAAPGRLHGGGWLVMEIGQGQAESVLALARAAGFVFTRVEPDLAGIPRALVARTGTAT